MKRIGLAIAIVAVANLLALGATAAWLALSGRLDGDRLNRVRALFMDETIAEEQARLRREAAEAREAERIAEENRMPDGLPVRSTEAVDREAAAVEAEEHRVRRLGEEVARLQAQLAARVVELDRQQRELEAEREEFARLRELVRRQESDAQFARALEVYEQLRPDEARDVFSEMLARGERLRVIAVLNAMEARKRSRVIAAFAQQEPDVAADLLVEIEAFGIETEAGGGQARDGDGIADAGGPGPA